ncbi:SCP-like protein [Ancylostoma caninum]|uniref:SCP-like protein n=1 Tax=Ancylostoma caninum TaxID=29170 RepID=A0A368FIB4_ANCCA|nr:SCP-like protein [Ancylostoma caninum]
MVAALTFFAIVFGLFGECSAMAVNPGNPNQGGEPQGPNEPYGPGYGPDGAPLEPYGPDGGQQGGGAPQGGGAQQGTTGSTQTSTTAPPTRPPWPKPNCGNPRLNNGLRNVFLGMHNNLRSSLAKGQTQTSRNWGIAPPAALMYRMKYSCDAESYAQQYVSSCKAGGLASHTHPGYKVNRHVLHTIHTDQSGAAQNAIATWWSELARFGMRSNMMFYASDIRDGKVIRWSKMAWWNNIHLGCAVQKCRNFYYTACMYKPGGNNINQHVYKVGAVCSGCPAGQCDGHALCRW